MNKLLYVASLCMLLCLSSSSCTSRPRTDYWSTCFIKYPGTVLVLSNGLLADSVNYDHVFALRSSEESPYNMASIADHDDIETLIAASVYMAVLRDKKPVYVVHTFSSAPDLLPVSTEVNHEWPGIFPIWLDANSAGADDVYPIIFLKTPLSEPWDEKWFRLLESHGVPQHDYKWGKNAHDVDR